MRVCKYLFVFQILFIGSCLIVVGAGFADAANKSKIKIYKRSSRSYTGVGAASCRRSETLVGGGCDCYGSVFSYEGGFLFSCVPVGNAYVGACYDLDYPQSRTPIEVEIRCVKSKSKSVKIYNTSDGLTSEESESSQVRKVKEKYRKRRADYNKFYAE